VKRNRRLANISLSMFGLGVALLARPEPSAITCSRSRTISARRLHWAASGLACRVSAADRIPVSGRRHARLCQSEGVQGVRGAEPNRGWNTWVSFVNSPAPPEPGLAEPGPTRHGSSWPLGPGSAPQRRKRVYDTLCALRLVRDTRPPPHTTCGVRISRGRMIAAAIASRQSAAKACSMVTKPPCSYSHATRPTEAPAAVKPMK